MPGIRIRVNQPHLGLVLVPVPTKPIPNADPCPTCRVSHNVKTVHLWLNSESVCLVSEGVLADLRTAGLEAHKIEIMDEVKNPPPLHFGPGVTRQQLDQQNDRITMWTRS
jgi:hypothetical protein